MLPDVPMGNAPETIEVTGTFATLKSRSTVTALYVGNLETYQGIDLMLEGFASCGVAG